MEPATALGVPTALLKFLSRASLWLLTAITIIFIGAVLIPTFQAAMPPEWVPWVLFGLFASSVLTTCSLASHLLTWFGHRRDVRRHQEKRTFTRIYKPAFALFMTRHTLQSTFTQAPRLSHRLRNAMEAFGYYQHWRARLSKTDLAHHPSECDAAWRDKAQATPSCDTSGWRPADGRDHLTCCP